MSYVYCHDAGAPTLNNAAGSLLTLLDHALVTGAGWTKEFTGTNKAVYRAPAGRRFYYRVDDSFGTYARVVGYESMTGVDTGTNPFPTEVQSTGGLYVPKASSASGFPYAIAASARGFLCWNQPVTAMPDSQSTASGYGGYFGFGDLAPVQSDDPYAVFLIGYTSNSYGSSGLPTFSASTVAQGHHFARSCSGVGSAVPFTKYSFATLTTYAYPNPADNGVYLDPVRTNEVGYALRGTIPGLWQSMHAKAYIPHGTQFSGFGALAGRSFVALEGYSLGYICLETSTDLWEY